MKTTNNVNYIKPFAITSQTLDQYLNYVDNLLAEGKELIKQYRELPERVQVENDDWLDLDNEWLTAKY